MIKVGDLRRVIAKLPDDASISIGYWTLTDLYGDQSLKAYTTTMCKEWVVTTYEDGATDLSLRTMTLEELYPETDGYGHGV